MCVDGEENGSGLVGGGALTSVSTDDKSPPQLTKIQFVSSSFFSHLFSSSSQHFSPHSFRRGGEEKTLPPSKCGKDTSGLRNQKSRMRVLSPQVFSHTTTYTSGQSEGPAKTEEMVLEEEEEEEPAFCLPPSVQCSALPPPKNHLHYTTSFPSSFSAGSRSPCNFCDGEKMSGGGFLWKNPLKTAKVYSTFAGSTAIYFCSKVCCICLHVKPTNFFSFPLKDL